MNNEKLGILDTIIDLMFGCDIIITFCTALVDDKVNNIYNIYK